MDIVEDYNAEVTPSQNPDQDFGIEGGNRVLQPPDGSEMLSQPKGDINRPKLPEKKLEVEDGDPMPDPLDVSYHPMTVVPPTEESEDVRPTWARDREE